MADTTRQPAKSGGPLSKNERIRLHNEKAKKHKRRRNALFIIMVLAAALSVVVILCLTVFFRIDSIRVEGDSRYTAQQIADASGIQSGDGLILLSPKKTQKNITTALVYIGEVQVKKQLSGVVVLTVSETKAAYSLNTGSGTVLFDAAGKVLEYPAASVPSDCAAVRGLTSVYTKPGFAVAAEDNREYALFALLAGECEQAGLSGITVFDVGDEYNIQLEYQGIYRIRLGSSADLKDKLLTAAEVLSRENTPPADRIVVIDVSDAGKAYVRNSEHTTAIPAEPVTEQPDDFSPEPEDADDSYDADDAPENAGDDVTSAEG